MAITLSEDSSGDNIYTGFWVNQAYGPFRGACLTLSHEAGGLLIAFLALFVTAASSSIWKMFYASCHLCDTNNPPAGWPASAKTDTSPKYCFTNQYCSFDAMGRQSLAEQSRKRTKENYSSCRSGDGGVCNICSSR
jgi:hypothetical protein